MLTFGSAKQKEEKSFWNFGEHSCGAKSLLVCNISDKKDGIIV